MTRDQVRKGLLVGTATAGLVALGLAATGTPLPGLVGGGEGVDGPSSGAETSARAVSAAADTVPPGARRDTAVFAGGCFWCMEPPYDELEGVFSTTSGYAGGHVPNPSYEEVSAGGTGHAEVVRVIYDPGAVSYDRLLDVYWHNVDPTDAGGQFCDRGEQYRTAVFYADAKQREAAEASKRALEKSGVLPGPVVTQIDSLEAFYPAESYHQDFYRKHSLRYRFYRTSCGRDRVLRELWGDAAGH